MDSIMPDLTKAQVISIFQAGIATAVAFGAPVSEQQSIALVGLATAFGSILVVSDAAIRRGRAANYDKIRGTTAVSELRVESAGDVAEARTVETPAPGPGELAELVARLDETNRLLRAVAERSEERLAVGAPS